MAKKAAAGAPAWMTTFADLMSLLLVLFVLLLTFAEMDIVKWKQLAGSMREAFGVAKKDKLSGMIELDGTMQRRAAANVDPTQRPEIIEVVSDGEMDAEAQAAKKAEAEMKELHDEIRKAISKEIAGSGMTVDREGDAVIIRFPSEIAFASGSDVLNQEFRETLAKLLPVIAKTRGEVVVSGHTDNIPLSGGGKFNSNWDLSAGRATAVIHWLVENQVDPARLAVQGFGDARPVVPNDTPENRAKNRRVEVALIQGAPLPGAPPTPADAPASSPVEGMPMDNVTFQSGEPSAPPPVSFADPIPTQAPVISPAPAVRSSGGSVTIDLPPPP